MNAAREEGEKEVNELIEECISIEKACMKRIEDLMEKEETARNI